MIMSRRHGHNGRLSEQWRINIPRDCIVTGVFRFLEGQFAVIVEGSKCRFEIRESGGGLIFAAFAFAEVDVVNHDLGGDALGPFPILPIAHLQTAGHKGGTSLFEVLLNKFCGFVPGYAIDKVGFSLTVLAFHVPIHRQAEGSHRLSGACKTDHGICRKTALQNDVIEHSRILSVCSRRGGYITYIYKISEQMSDKTDSVIKNVKVTPPDLIRRCLSDYLPCLLQRPSSMGFFQSGESVFSRRKQRRLESILSYITSRP